MRHCRDDAAGPETIIDNLVRFGCLTLNVKVQRLASDFPWSNLLARLNGRNHAIAGRDQVLQRCFQARFDGGHRNKGLGHADCFSDDE